MAMKGNANPQGNDGANPALWDDIEAKYWDSIRIWRAREDEDLKAKYESQRKELDHQQLHIQNARANLAAERLELLERLKAIDSQVTKVEEESTGVENRLRVLDDKMEAEQIAFARLRAADDAEKRDMFEKYRLASTMSQSTFTSEIPVRTAKVDSPGDGSNGDADAPSNGSINGDGGDKTKDGSNDNVNGSSDIDSGSSGHGHGDNGGADFGADMSVDVDVDIGEDAGVGIGNAGVDINTSHKVNDNTKEDTNNKASNDAKDNANANTNAKTNANDDPGPSTNTNGDQVMTDAVPEEAADDSGGIEVIGEPGERLADAEMQSVSSVLSQFSSTPPLSEFSDRSKEEGLTQVKESTSGEVEPQQPKATRQTGRKELDESPKGPERLVDGSPKPVKQPEQPEPSEQTESSLQVITLSPVDEDPAAKVEVVDGSGRLVGRLRRIKLDNHWVNRVLSLPIKRQVEIRAGRKFNEESLESVYEPSDIKGAKWLSCFIQATGEFQKQPCQTCAKASGPFQDCVLLGGDDFPRCGNCEWNRQGCNLQPRPRSRLSSGGESAFHKSLRKPSLSQVKETTPPNLGLTVVNPSLTAQGPADDADCGDTEMADIQHEKAAFESRFSARKSRPETKKPAPATPVATTPLSGSPAPEMDEEDVQKLPVITKDILALRDDGVVFTAPPCMCGVPLAKISPDHPYWEKDWQSIEEVIEPILKKWKDKYNNHMAVGASQSSKFLANRQVNRGTAILKFLREGELHPYQILAKKYISKQFVSYDTLFRMVQILEELEKFNIDVTPSQWLRQRLHEVCIEMGDDFNLGKTVHDLYHDPKVIALRARSGFGNIGRPSGYRPDKTGEGQKKSTRGPKRKEPHVTPKSTPIAEVGSSRPRSSRREPRSPADRHRSSVEQLPAREAKKPRLLASPPAVEDLEFEGYTSSDSYSEDHVMQVDWRVYQVKTRDRSSNTSVTQYWHWVDKADSSNEGNMFEHQVLGDMRNHKVSWGVYKEPVDFHLRLSELTVVTYAVNSQKVIIGTKQIKGVNWRGDVLAHFKRERTKRRFLSFIKAKGVKLQKTSLSFVEGAWKELVSEVLPKADATDDSE